MLPLMRGMERREAHFVLVSLPASRECLDQSITHGLWINP